VVKPEERNGRLKGIFNPLYLFWPTTSNCPLQTRPKKRILLLRKATVRRPENGESGPTLKARIILKNPKRGLVSKIIRRLILKVWANNSGNP